MGGEEGGGVRQLILKYLGARLPDSLSKVAKVTYARGGVCVGAGV